MKRISAQTAANKRQLRPTLAATTAALMLGMTLLSAQAFAAEPFGRGNTVGSINVGAGRALDQNYTTVGGTLGYMVSDGLMVAATASKWFGNDPGIWQLTPEVRYTFIQGQPFKPYIGGFVSRTFYDGPPDRNTYGMRGGVAFPFSSNAALNVGVVYEKISSCDNAAYRDCSQVYPEASVLFSF